ncbi:MAG: thrombospondin type 3 repeat-containing protein [Deltaproteobacteria bacterium]|nr:thrombospondin type 3 repeat-containing protein [Deltaproteobacteria bacterium]
MRHRLLTVVVGLLFVQAAGCREFRWPDGRLPFEGGWPQQGMFVDRIVDWILPSDVHGEGHWSLKEPAERVTQPWVADRLEQFLDDVIRVRVDIKNASFQVYLDGRDVLASSGEGNTLARQERTDLRTPLFEATFAEVREAYGQMCDPDPLRDAAGDPDTDPDNDCLVGSLLGTCPLPIIPGNADPSDPMEGLSASVSQLSAASIEFASDVRVRWSEPSFPTGVPQLSIQLRGAGTWDVPWWLELPVWLCTSGDWTFVDVELMADVRIGEGRCPLGGSTLCGNGRVDPGEACDDGGAAGLLSTCPDDCAAWTWWGFHGIDGDFVEPSDPRWETSWILDTANLVGTPKNLDFSWSGRTADSDYSLQVDAGFWCWLVAGLVLTPIGAPIILGNLGESLDAARKMVFGLGSRLGRLLSAFLNFGAELDEGLHFAHLRTLPGVSPALIRMLESSAGATAAWWRMFSGILQQGDQLVGSGVTEFTEVTDAGFVEGSRETRFRFDADQDCDGVPDSEDNCLVVANPEQVFEPDQADRDGDGFGDACDLCPDTASPSNADLDEDGLGDACDGDLDGDGCINEWDERPGTPNPPCDYAPEYCDRDGDGLPNDCDPDEDGDTVPNDTDNCRRTPNPDQLDSDGDGRGDACDSDDDGDGIPDSCERFPDECPFDGLDEPEWGPEASGTDLLGGCLFDIRTCDSLTVLGPRCPPNVACCETCDDSWVHVYDAREGSVVWSTGARDLGVARSGSRRMSGSLIGAWDGVDGQHIAVGFPEARLVAPIKLSSLGPDASSGRAALRPSRSVGKVVVLGVDGRVQDELVGAQSGAAFGSAVAPIADLLAVGAPGTDFGGWTDAGAVLLMRRGEVVATIRGRRDGERFGQTLNAGPDLDGDGVAELLVGAPGGPGLAGSPRAYVVSLAGHVASVIDTPKIDGGFAGAGLAWIQVPAATSILVGAPNDGTWRGQEWGTLHAFTADGSPLWDIAGDAPWQHFGWAAAFGTDLDHDGRREMIGGGPGDWTGQSFIGRVYVRNVGQPAAWSDVPARGAAYEILGPGAFLFGYSVASVGDVTGDGFDDLGISMPLMPASTAGHRGHWLVLTKLGATKPPNQWSDRWLVSTVPSAWR